jgi:hypothetical protein
VAQLLARPHEHSPASTLDIQVGIATKPLVLSLKLLFYPIQNFQRPIGVERVGGIPLTVPQRNASFSYSESLGLLIELADNRSEMILDPSIKSVQSAYDHRKRTTSAVDACGPFRYPFPLSAPKSFPGELRSIVLFRPEVGAKSRRAVKQRTVTGGCGRKVASFIPIEPTV